MGANPVKLPTSDLVIIFIGSQPKDRFTVLQSILGKQGKDSAGKLGESKKDTVLAQS